MLTTLYLYVDTIYPENGIHPYTKDRWTGQMWYAQDALHADGSGVLVPDLAGRVSALDLQPPVLTS